MGQGQLKRALEPFQIRKVPEKQEEGKIERANRDKSEDLTQTNKEMIERKRIIFLLLIAFSLNHCLS